MTNTERTIGEYRVMAEAYDNYVEFIIGEDNGYGFMEDPIMTGHIKWDGCSNWKLEQPLDQFHFCDHKEELGKITSLFQALYEWAIELTPQLAKHPYSLHNNGKVNPEKTELLP